MICEQNGTCWPGGDAWCEFVWLQRWGQKYMYAVKCVIGEGMCVCFDAR